MGKGVRPRGRRRRGWFFVKTSVPPALYFFDAPDRIVCDKNSRTTGFSVRATRGLMQKAMPLDAGFLSTPWLPGLIKNSAGGDREVVALEGPSPRRIPNSRACAAWDRWGSGTSGKAKH